MSFKKIQFVLLAVLLTFSVGISSAQEGEEDLFHFTWAGLGMSFDVPSGWQQIQDERFEFVLIAPAEPGSQTGTFVGLQTGVLPAGDTLQSFIEDFALQFETPLEEITFGETDAYFLDIAAVEGEGKQAFIAYSSGENEIAMLIFQDVTTDLENATAILDMLVSSLSIEPLGVDVAAISEQLQASLAENGTLVIGNADAPVKMVEVLDFSCIHCVRYNASIERLIQSYVQNDAIQLEFVFVTFVGAEASVTATHVQYCAIEQGVGWEVHDLLMNGYLSSDGRSFYTLENIMPSLEAAELDLDLDELSTCVEEERYADAIEQGITRATEEFQVTGTPSLLFTNSDEAPAFILRDGQPMSGGIQLDVVFAYLDQLLEDGG